MAVAGAVLGGCGSGSRAGSDGGEEKLLYVYNWADYIGKSTLADFERATGIKVVYDTYDADETLEAKMMAGDSGYDIVSTSTDYFSRQIKAGIYQPLERGKLPNWKNLDPHVLAIEARADPGNRYAVPYLRHVNGFAYNIDMVKARMPDAPLDSLDMLFKPEVIARFADCGVTFLDSAEDVLQLALNYLHIDPNTTRKEDYQRAEQLIVVGAALHPCVRFHRVHEWARQQGVLHLHVVVGRLRGVPRPGAGRRREGESGVHRAQGGRQRLLRCAVDSQPARRIPRPRTRFLELHARAAGHCRGDQRHSLRERQPGGQRLSSIRRSSMIRRSIRPPEIEARLYESAEVAPALERIRTRTWTRIKTAQLTSTTGESSCHVCTSPRRRS